MEFSYACGVRKTKYFRIDTLKEMSVLEAHAHAYELHKIVHAGGDPREEINARLNRLSFNDFVTVHYMPHAKLKKRSWEVDLRMLRLHVLPVFGARKLEKIHRINVVLWQNRLRTDGLAAGTCNRVLALLRFVFNCAICWECCLPGRILTGASPLLTTTARRERYLTEEEARQLIAALDALPNRLSALAIKLLLYA